ncbi:hypothetical protein ACX1NX_08660 [Acinetobacter sp. ANC 5383]
MGCPKITLQEWCKDDEKSKREFFKAESQRKNGCLCLDQNRYIPSSKLLPENPNDWLQSVIITTLSTGQTLSLCITEACFTQLKNRYKAVKKKERDRGLIKKQYSFQPALAHQIKKIKENHRWAREEDAIEYLVNGYVNQKIAYETFTKINQSPIRLTTMHNQIKQLEEHIEFLQNRHNDILTQFAQSELMRDFYLSIIKKNNIDKSEPDINQDEINKRKLEISLNLRSAFKVKT